jgi:hypothetical protein
MYSGRFGNPGNKPLKPQNPSNSPYISNVEKRRKNLKEDVKQCLMNVKRLIPPLVKMDGYGVVKEAVALVVLIRTKNEQINLAATADNHVSHYTYKK